jgi:septal ring-binding cell division protein DamX
MKTSPYRAGTFTLLVLAVSLAACAQRPAKTHEEDLSWARPKFTTPVDSQQITSKKEIQEVKPTLTVNGKVDAVLDSISKLHALRKFTDGYTIQIYSGQNREEANSVKKKMTEQAGDMKADLQYVQPKFRVITGNYFTKLEAQPDLLRLRRIFPTAILVPEKIPIR